MVLGDMAVGYSESTTSAYFLIDFPMTMRASPATSFSGATDFYVRTIPGGYPATTAMAVVGSSTTNSFVNVTVSSGLTAKEPNFLIIRDAGDWIQWSAEL